MSDARRISSNAVYWLASAAALGGALWAMAAGLAPRRLGPVVWFLSLAFGAASYVLFATLAIRRRASRLQSAPIPSGVRLGRPLWIPLAETFDIVRVAGALGAIAAAVGFPGVGTGIVLALGALGVFMVEPLAIREGLTFEPTGLRVHGRHGQFLVPWTSVLEVENLTPQSRRPSTNVRIASASELFASASPDTERSRFHVRLLLYAGIPSGQALCFLDWTAGLDSATLTRAIREAMGQRPPRIN